MVLFQQQIDGYGEVVSANSTKTTAIREPLPIRATVMYEVKDNACLSQTNKKFLLKQGLPLYALYGRKRIKTVLCHLVHMSHLPILFHHSIYSPIMMFCTLLEQHHNYNSTYIIDISTSV